MEYNSGSNRASNFKSREADLKLRARLLPELYDTNFDIVVIRTFINFKINILALKVLKCTVDCILVVLGGVEEGILTTMIWVWSY